MEISNALKDTPDRHSHSTPSSPDVASLPSPMHRREAESQLRVEGYQPRSGSRYLDEPLTPEEPSVRVPTPRPDSMDLSKSTFMPSLLPLQAMPDIDWAHWWPDKSKVNPETTSKDATESNPPPGTENHAILSESPEHPLSSVSRPLSFVGDDPWTSLQRSRSDKNTWPEGPAEGGQSPGLLCATPPLLSASDSGYGTAVPPDLYCPTCGWRSHTSADMRQVLAEFPAGKWYVFTNRDRKHELRHTKPYVCLVPGCLRKEGFTTAYGLRRHDKLVHSKYCCSIGTCKLLTSPDNFRRHLWRAHELDYRANSAELEKFKVKEATVASGLPKDSVV